MARNMKPPVTSVSATAISGEMTVINWECSERFSSNSRMAHPVLLLVGSSHQTAAQRHRKFGRRQGPVTEPLLRHEGGTSPAARIDADGALRPAIDRQHSCIGERPFARDRVEKLRLAVAGDASDGDHFAPLHIKRNALERHGELA